MRVVRCTTAAEFLERARGFLLGDEACHHLLLGVAGSMAASPHRPEDTRAYFAVAMEGRSVVAAAMIAPPWRVVVSRTAHPSSLRLIAEDLLRCGIAPPGVHAPAPVGEQFAAAWRTLTGQRAEPGLVQRIYRLERVRPVPPVPGRLRRATGGDRALLVPWLDAFLLETFGGRATESGGEETFERRLRDPAAGLHLWEDGAARTVAGHGGPTPHGIRIGPVYTPPEHRGRGYATACVAAVSRLLLERGYRSCFLYADLANPASNRIYQRIGYEPVCDVAEYRFGPDRGPAPA
jgi:uncharacterized protein